MEWRINLARDHLRVALRQVAPSDDQILVEHMRDALSLLDAEAEKQEGQLEALRLAGAL